MSKYSTIPAQTCSAFKSNSPSLFQAPREKREGEGEGTKTRGAGERKRGKEEEPVIILLNTS